MNEGQFNLAMKMIKEDYKLEDQQILMISRRLMADDREFEKVWSAFKGRRIGSVDTFRDLLRELLS
jgi:hypothetical protein